MIVPVVVVLGAFPVMVANAQVGSALPAATSVDELARWFRSDDWLLRYAAYEALIEAGPVSIPAFVEASFSSDRELRALAISGLRQLGSAAAPVARLLHAALDDDDETIRLTAAWALVDIGAPSVELLRASLADDDGYTRTLAAWALGRIGAEAAAAAPDLIALIEDSPPYVRWTAMDALVGLGPGDGAVDALVGQLWTDAQPNPFMRAAAAQLLGHIDELPVFALSALGEAAGDGDALVRRNALSAIRRQVQVPDEAFLDLLEGTGPGVEYYISPPVAELPDGGVSFAHQVVRAMDDTDAAVRAQAVTAVGHMLPRERAVLEYMVHTAQSDADEAVRGAAISAALLHLQVHFHPTTGLSDLMERALRDEDPLLRRAGRLVNDRYNFLDH